MKLKYDFVIQEVAGSFIAVAIGAGSENFKGMIRLNNTAKHIFESIQQGKNQQEIVQSMLEDFDVTEQEAQKATADFLSQLQKSGLLVE